MIAPHWAYFDPSVLVKRYVKEAGSSATRRLLQRFRFLSSAVAPVEALSALSRRGQAVNLGCGIFSPSVRGWARIEPIGNSWK